MSPSATPRTSSSLTARIAVLLTSLALLLVGLPFGAGTASAATAQRIELRVLVLDGGGASERAIKAQLAREGIPTTTVDLTAANRPALTAAFLADDATGTAHFQGVVQPTPAAPTAQYPARLTAAEQTVLATYERAYGVREIAANVFPGGEVSPAFTGGPSAILDGGTGTPTAAALADGFSYLNGAAFTFDDVSSTVAESTGILGNTPTLSAGETFTPMITASKAGVSGWLAGVYARDGREQLLVSAAYNENQQWFGQIGHGLVSWLTRGINQGFQRAYFAVHVDDIFLADSRWSSTANCTPGDGCVGNVTTTDIRMTPADVSYLVQWQRDNDFALDMVYNAWGTQPDTSTITPTTPPATSTDPLTAAFLAAQANFPWINHTYSHPYLGCIQIAPTVSGASPTCATSVNQAGRQDPEIPGQMSGGTAWASQDFIRTQVAINAAWGSARGLTDFDPTELVTGEHSGLQVGTAQPTDNPFLAAALASAGVRVTASDNSRETTSRPVQGAGSTTVTMPRYPMNIYYNAATYQDQIDEYNWYYAPRSSGQGGGICEANPATTTCMPSALPAADNTQAEASYNSYLKPLEVRNALARVLSNDPRPFYAHQSNLTENRLLLPVVQGVLQQYRATHATNAPLVRTDMTAQQQVLSRMAAWTAQSSANVGYIDATGVHVPSVAGVSVPVTVPASATAPASAGLASYGGQQSGWTTGGAVIPLAVPLGGYGGTAAPVASSAPVVGVPVPGDGSAIVSWTAPVDTGGSAVREYTVTTYLGDTATVVGTPVTASGSATSIAVTGLTNGTPYTFTVVAKTLFTGTNATSVRTVAVTPSAAAAAPVAPSQPSVSAVATVEGVSASWTVPVSDGGSPITGYTIEATSGGATVSTQVPADQLDGVVTGLTAGIPYDVTVRAVNAVGAGTRSGTVPLTPLAAGAAPGVPTSVRAVGGDKTVTVTWTAPASVGSAPLQGYGVTLYGPNGALPFVYTGTTDTSYQFTGLTNGTGYVAYVAAYNGNYGPGSAASATATPKAVSAAAAPGAPSVSSLVVSSGQLQVGWTAPATDGGAPVTSYSVTVLQGTTTTVAKTATAAAGARTATVTGLANGTSYSVVVSATNTAGTTASAPSTTVTPVGLPTAPVVGTLTAGDRSVALTWTAPSSVAGGPIQAYDVNVYAGTTLVRTQRALGNATGATITGLTVGTAYTADVVALNAAGSSAASARSAAASPFLLAAPAAPAAPTVTSAPAALNVSWTAPAANGTPAVTGYTVTVYQGTTATVVKTVQVTGATTAVVTGLVNGTGYTVTVSATNSVGTGPASPRSAVVTPAVKVPGAPTITAVAPGTQALTVSWSAPADNGGAAITGYTVTVYTGTSNTVARTATAAAGATSLQIGALTANQPYSVTVAARNSAGTGAASARSATVTPASVFATPSAPTITSVTPGAGRVTVTWTPPTATGLFGVSGYTITVYNGTGTTVARTATTGSGGRTATVIGLTRGQSYTVVVTPRNLFGTGTPSARSAAVTAL